MASLYTRLPIITPIPPCSLSYFSVLLQCSVIAGWPPPGSRSTRAHPTCACCSSAFVPGILYTDVLIYFYCTYYKENGGEALPGPQAAATSSLPIL